ncbi:unnamed protein product, partial [Brenthis ino]
MNASIWNHYEKIPGKSTAKCLLCKKEYSYKTTITNLKKHLKHKHISAYQNFLNSYQTETTRTTENRQQSIFKQEAESSNTSQQQAVHPAVMQIVPPGRTFKSKYRRQQQTTAYVPRKMDEKQKKNIDKKLLRIITQDYQPFSVVEDNGFKSFVEALNPSYELPNRKLISKTLIPGRYLDCKNQMMELVQKAKKVCLTTDCWTSQDMDAYLAVTAHFLIDFEMKTVLLHCEHFSGSHTADALAEALKNIAIEWNIVEKITLAVSDNTANITSAIGKTGWPIFGCFLHKLNLIIEKAIVLLDFILEKVKKIVGHFKKSNLATESLAKYQIDRTVALRLIQSVPTRWNSVYYMLERFLKLQGALQAVLPNLRSDLPIITVEMWETLRQVCIILKPFEEITQIMSSTHYLTASLAIVIVDGLKNVMSIMKTKPIYGVAKTFLLKLEEGLEINFPRHVIEDNMLLGLCTFLDPRFKIHAFLDNASAEVEPTLETTSQRITRVNLIKEHILDLLKIKIRKKRGTPAVETISYIPPRAASTSQDIETISIWGKIDKTIAAMTPSVDDIATSAENELEMFINEPVYNLFGVIVHRETLHKKTNKYAF